MEQLSEVAITVDDAVLGALVGVPSDPEAVVAFAHGTGSSRFSPRNAQVALGLRSAGIATVLSDLLTEEEAADRSNVFDIGLVTRRLLGVVEWVQQRPGLRELPMGLFGASTGAAAALRVAAALGDRIGAVVSRGGRPDLAHPDEAGVRSPTLLVVGGEDRTVIDLNRRSFTALTCTKDLAIVPGAGHLFEEPGALEEVTALATEWFRSHLIGPEEAA